MQLCIHIIYLAHAFLWNTTNSLKCVPERDNIMNSEHWGEKPFSLVSLSVRRGLFVFFCPSLWCWIYPPHEMGGGKLNRPWNHIITNLFATGHRCSLGEKYRLGLEAGVRAGNSTEAGQGTHGAEPAKPSIYCLWEHVEEIFPCQVSTTSITIRAQGGDWENMPLWTWRDEEKFQRRSVGPIELNSACRAAGHNRQVILNWRNHSLKLFVRTICLEKTLLVCFDL